MVSIALHPSKAFWDTRDTNAGPEESLPIETDFNALQFANAPSPMSAMPLENVIDSNLDAFSKAWEQMVRTAGENVIDLGQARSVKHV